MICFVYWSLDYCDLMRGFYCTPPCKTLFIKIMLCFIVFFFLINFFLISFCNIIIFFLFNYQTFITQPCNQIHIQGFRFELHSNSIKLGSCKFNIIVNIINITCGSGVADRLNALRYNFATRPNTLRS